MANRIAKRGRRPVAEEKVQIGVYVTVHKRARLDAERLKERRSSLSEMCDVLLDEALDARHADETATAGK